MKNAGAISWAGADAGEAALVERCVARDEVACAELVSAHQRMVYALAFHLLNDRDDALDVSQEVFLRVFRTLPSFRGQSALRTWIFRIVVNQARNRQRWWNRRRRGSQVSLDDHIHLCGDMPSQGEVLPDRQLASKETATLIWQALDRLPFDQAAIAYGLNNTLPAGSSNLRVLLRNNGSDTLHSATVYYNNNNNIFYSATNLKYRS